MKSSHIVLFILILIAFTSCKLTDDKIKTGWWKYDNGFHLGDELIFNDSNFKNDTIFSGEKPIALIISKASFSGNNKITIKSISSGEVGVYIQR